jgi:hypothetical protein
MYYRQYAAARTTGVSNKEYKRTNKTLQLWEQVTVSSAKIAAHHLCTLQTTILALFALVLVASVQPK